jgi:hypothetical protein
MDCLPLTLIPSALVIANAANIFNEFALVRFLSINSAHKAAVLY